MDGRRINGRAALAWLSVGLIVVLLGLGAVALHARASNGGPEGAADPPARLVPIGDTGVSEVHLTADAVRRAGIRSEPVRAVQPAGANRSALTAVSLDAVVYDKDGASWVYTSPRDLTFVRRRITVSRVEGETVLLSAGPPVGTAVVTVGAAELLGCEYAVSGE